MFTSIKNWLRTSTDKLLRVFVFSDLHAIGAQVQRGEPIARVHARTRADARAAIERALSAVKIDPRAVAPGTPVKWASAHG